jgi:hypothetical protein
LSSCREKRGNGKIKRDGERERERKREKREKTERIDGRMEKGSGGERKGRGIDMFG